MTTGSVCCIFLFKLYESNDSTRISVQLVHRATHWYNVAVHDSCPLMTLQHYGMAMSMLDAARSLVSDYELQRKTGINIARYARKVEQKARKTRQSVLASSIQEVSRTLEPKVPNP